jgi:MFS family permease
MNETPATTSPARAAGYSTRVFAVCLLGWILSNMDQSLFGYAIPSLLAEFDVGLPVIGTILSAAFVLAAVTVVIAGVLADRYGRRVMFVACLALSALLVGVQAFTTSLLALAVLRCLSFSIATGLVPITNALVVEAAPARLRGVLAGLLQCGYPLGWFIASLLAVPMMANWGWRAMFLPALAVIPLAFLLGRWLPESDRFRRSRSELMREPRVSSLGAMRLIWSGPYRFRAIGGTLAFFLFGGAYAGTAFYFPTFYQQVRGYSLEDATFVVGLAYGIGMFGYVAASLVGEYVTTRRNTIVAWTWIGALAVLGVIWNEQGFWGNVAWFGLTAMFFYGTAAVLTTYVTEIFPTYIRATAVAMVAGVGINSGFAVYPSLVAGLVESIGWSKAFTFTVVPSLTVVGLIVLALPNVRSGIELEAIAPVRA